MDDFVDRAEVAARIALAANWDTLAHTTRVAFEVQRSRNPWATAAAWLHDVVEDTPVTEDDLFDIGIPPRVITAVRYLTRLPGQSYEVYKLALLSYRGDAADDARLVKLLDAEDNLDRCLRSLHVTKWARLAQERYRPLVEELERAMERTVVRA